MFLPDLEDGSSIFIDANIFVYHFFKKSKFNPTSSNFLERAEKGEIKGITSTSVVQEATHRMMIMEAATILPDLKTKNIVGYLKAHSDIVKKLITHQVIPEKIASFNLEIISPDINTIQRSQQMKRRYGFLSMEEFEGHLKKTIQSGKRKQDTLNPQKYREPAPNNYIVTAYQKEIG